MKITRKFTVRAPQQVCFDVLKDIASWPLWEPDTVAVGNPRYTHGGNVCVVAVTEEVNGHRVTTDLKIDSSYAPKLVTVEIASPEGDYTLREEWWLVEQSDGTYVRFVLEMKPRVRGFMNRLDANAELADQFDTPENRSNLNRGVDAFAHYCAAIAGNQSSSNSAPPGSTEATASELVEAFRVLGLDAGADEGEIRDTYRALAQIFHPDRYVQAPERVRKEAAERMSQVNAAFQFISRAGCDRQRRAG